MKALITWGGWEGHEPEQVATQFQDMLMKKGFHVDVYDALACFDDAEALTQYALIVPVWTMSDLTKERALNVSHAVSRGTGLAGCHGGMCDAFRTNVLWQFMTGANWVAHPGGDGVRYRVNIVDKTHDTTQGIMDFDVCSEQYYLHVDPANHVLATTQFPTVNWLHSPNGPVDMPVAWTRAWGLGRVYYNALGHKQNVIASGPAYDMIDRGFDWAAAGHALARERQSELATWQSPGNHF